MTTTNNRTKTPEEKFEEASFELAIYRLLRRDLEMIEDCMSKSDKEEAAQIANRTMPRMLTMIEQTIQRVDIHRCIIKQGINILKIAALAILIVNMGITIAAAANSNVRARIIYFLMEMNDSYMDIRFSGADKDISVPENWLESYYPAYIPEGYSIKQCLPYKDCSTVIFSDEKGGEISVKICSTDAFSSLNTEGAKISYVNIQNVTAMVLEQPYSEFNIVWAVGKDYFIVCSNTDYETTLHVAQSVALIQK